MNIYALLARMSAYRTHTGADRPTQTCRHTDPETEAHIGTP